MIHSAQPIVPAGSDYRSILKFFDVWTDGRTTCVKIVITVVGLVDQNNERKKE